MEFKDTIKTITLKSFSLFFYIKLPNILLMLCALYFSSLFIFAKEGSVWNNVQQVFLHAVIWSAVLSIAAGYIINHFYDKEEDSIRKPISTYIKSFIAQKDILQLYLLLNIMSLVISFVVSWKLMVLFLCYQFLIWLYSHKFSSQPTIRPWISTLLTLYPFMVLALIYNNLSWRVWSFGILLGMYVLLKNFLKEINSVPDATYQKQVKRFILILYLLSTVILVYLSTVSYSGYLRYFFMVGVPLNIMSIALIFSTIYKKYVWLEWGVKAYIALGVFAIIFIDWNPLHLIR